MQRCRSHLARLVVQAAAAAPAAPPAPLWACLRQLTLGAPRGGGAAAAAAAAPELPPWRQPRSPKPVELPAEALSLAPRPLAPSSRRTGVVALKCGMTCDWTPWGDRVPLTVLWLDEVQVVQVKTAEKEGYDSLQVGAGSRKAKQVSSPLGGHFKWAGVPIKRRLVEFRVSRDALLPVGTALGAAHFAPGQYVDVSGRTGGKGFAGGMKRHGFAGQGASHGNSVSHRALGSTGCRQDPGRVWKGKKMPGQMGGGRHTVQSLLVYKVDADRGLLYLKGAVPGHSGGWLEVRDALRKRPGSGPAAGPPEVAFPTALPGGGAGGVRTAPPAAVNPFDVLSPERNVKKKE